MEKTNTSKGGVIILGSARSDGNTAQIAQHLGHDLGWPVVNLLDYQIEPYSYQHAYANEDFERLIERLHDYQIWVFATPVYWYSMSGRMKNFLDRFTDLLKIRKDLGRQLRGKNMAVVTSSNGGNLGNDFFIPFRASAEYLGMHYVAEGHTLQGENNAAVLEELKVRLVQSVPEVK
ncbi:MAG: NAD(P)H-dependent oxidoreductase [Bacteroidota bacterium]